jgi:hypothetical protein
MQLAATYIEYYISSYDIKSAFLSTPYPSDEPFYIKVQPDLVEHWLKRRPQDRKYLNPDGTLTFKLLRYLYGLHEAPHAFNGYLDTKLKAIGFTQSTSDKCLYYTLDEASQQMAYMSVHVDDIFLLSPTNDFRARFEKAMSKDFILDVQHDQLSYLNMSFKRDKDGISVSQHGYVNNLLKKYAYDPSYKPKTPSHPHLTRPSNPTSPTMSQNKYLSLIMSLLYLARFTRPDILKQLTLRRSPLVQPRKITKRP